ncbi:hypothetical protein L2E82_01008 [Cichorium intybus]|uniref:Uncharacterized protein n=1 Tax=Cichorium intybus TaxID=13427 RepID=A0ACB9GYH7_CICIN|nr:hypothetical protein L2E82_01008 [Cichorium intybus]
MAMAKEDDGGDKETITTRRHKGLGRRWIRDGSKARIGSITASNRPFSGEESEAWYAVKENTTAMDKSRLEAGLCSRICFSSTVYVAGVQNVADRLEGCGDGLKLAGSITAGNFGAALTSIALPMLALVGRHSRGMRE